MCRLRNLQVLEITAKCKLGPSRGLEVFNVSGREGESLQAIGPLDEVVFLNLDRDSGNALVRLVVLRLLHEVLQTLQLGGRHVKKHGGALRDFLTLQKISCDKLNEQQPLAVGIGYETFSA